MQEVTLRVVIVTDDRRRTLPISFSTVRGRTR